MKQHVDPDVAFLPPTYIFSSSKVAAKIVNDDNKLFKYEWRLYSSKEEEKDALSNCDIYSPEDRSKFHSMLLFQSETLSIEPICGEIWPQRFQQFIIHFNPKRPNINKEIAHLYNLETEERIPFEINANGLQPTAEFSVDQIDLAHINLDKPKTFQVNLINTGKVPFDFELEKRTPVHLKFKFSPTSGHLDVGQSIPVTIDFAANYVGQFNETFTYHIVGFSQGHPSISIYGRVIGASYQISKDLIDFGNVSYGFLYTQEFEITNSSGIPFDFALSLKQDKSFDAREFSINPSIGSIPKFSKQIVKVEFIPIFVQDYSVTLNIEGTKSEEQLGSIKLVARSLCPEISIQDNIIDLGNIFIHHEYTTSVSLVDDTDFPAKFEFIEIDDQSSLDMKVVFLKYRGSIGPHTTAMCPIKVTPKQLGHIELQRSIRIYGSNFPPIPYTIKALCTGPNLLFPSNIIDFGGTPVLQDIVKIFPIKNDSLIPAIFSFEIKGESMFRIEPKSGIIEPGKTLDLNVIANLDDSINYSEKLFMSVKYLTTMTFEIKAKGTGTAIVSSIDMKLIDLGYVFTSQPAIINFTLTNNGRRNQELKWGQQKAKIEGNNRASVNYKIVPDSTIIEPKETINCQIVLECNANCAFSLNPTCQAAIGRQRYDLYKTEIKGIFIKPMITFATESLIFKYVHDVEQEEKLTGKLTTNELITPSKSLLMPITLGDTIKNNSELPLDIEVRCEKPFQISQSSFFLQPQETAPFDITFHTDFKKNFTTEIVEKKIYFHFRDNPHKYAINLKGLMIFPNLSFSPNNVVNFGILLKGTEETRIIKATNSGTVPARFLWELKNKQSFDIYPINDVIEPGETKDVHVTFYAGEGTHFKNTAVCHVIGGPEYQIELNGSSSSIDYSLDKRVIDFGKRDYRETLTDNIVLTNNSLVPINYHIKLPKGLGFHSFSIEPQKGVLNHKDKAVFNFKLVAGFPRSYSSLFNIQIGNFDEVQIDIHVDCYIPQLLFSIPRINNETNNMTLDSEKKFMIEKFTDIYKKPRRPAQKLGSILVFRGIELSSYKIDFGEIILGDNKTLSCELKNVTPYPISMEMLASSLNGTGFSISTTSFRDIPQNERINIIFSFESDKKTTTNTGKVNIPIPLIFSDEIGYTIHLIAEIKMPVLSFSKTNFTFETTIIGQKWIQTMQLRNMNPISIPFNIEPCQSPNILQRTKYNKDDVFTAYPSNGVLPPYSFLNIDLTFAPTAEKNYSMQFPINIKYSDQVFVQVKGTGTQMKVTFDPPEVDFQSLQPFSDKSIATVDIVNNSLIGVEVFSQQFDFQLLCNSLTKQFISLTNSEPEQIPVATFSKPKSNTISKFSLVVVVHGPPKSGRTTVSEKLSQMLGIPILSLKHLFYDKFDLPDNELIEILQKTITSPEFIKGFIIDGLDAFPDNTPENEQFIMSFLKQKSTLDELSKNPYTVLNHPIVTTTEKVLNLITASLDGQYLFLVGLNANEIICHQHESLNEAEEKHVKIERIKKEMEDLFNMDEDAYMKLSEYDRQIVDKKREHYRRYKIEHNGDLSEYEPLIDEDSQKSQSINHSKGRNKKVPRGQVPNDPLLQAVILFQYTFGRLAEKTKEECQNFNNLYQNNISPNEEIQQQIIQQILSSTEKKKKEEPVFKSIANSNCLIVNAMDTIESVMEEIITFIPKFDVFKDKAAVVPQSYKIMPDSSNIELLPFPDLFSIVSEEPPGDFPEFLKPPQPSSQHKKTRKSTSKMESSPYVNLISEIDPINYTCRWKIPPNSRVTLKLAFDSSAIGVFQDELLFGLVNCRNDLYKLPVKGFCYFADVDRSPKAIFPKILGNKTTKAQNAFITNTNEFYFGALLIVKERTRNSQPAYKATLNLVNNSEFLVEAHCELQVAGVKTPWALETPTQSINPGETGNIVIGFNPSTVDVYKNKLTVYIKDNPEPLYINLAGEGCSPNCEVSTTSIDFDKLLLSMTRTLNFSLKNVGKVPAFWKIKGGNVLGNNFKISELEGNIKEGGSTNITITYSSEKAYCSKKALQIDIFDINKNRVFMSHHVSVAAESFDVLFDFIYPKGLDHLSFGTTKVGQEKMLQCTLRNRGKYPSEYKIFLNKTFNHKSLIKISPDEGQVPVGDKGVLVNVTFKADSAKKFTNCKAINLRITDPINNQVTSTITLPFSVETVYSSYVISPEKVLDFGPIPVSTTATKEIKLKNVGVFPFDFEVYPKIEIIEPSGSMTKNGKGRKSIPKKPNPRQSPITKGKKKGNGKDFAIDHFHVSQSGGNINPDNDVNFNVSFNSIVDGVFENTIIFKISDSVPKIADGFPLKLRASVFIPGIITDDFEKIFPNQHLCLRYDIIKRDTAAFIEDEQVYHFAPSVLKQTSTVGIAMINPLPIPCVVDITLKPRTKNQQNKFPFDVSSKAVKINPNSTTMVDMTFTPQFNELFKGLFEAVVRGGLNANTKLMKFGIEGAGTLPAITIVDNPKCKPVSFGKTLVGTNKHKRITLQNNGVIPAHLTITTTNTTGDFELENIDTVQKFTLDVHQLYSLHVNYCPQTNRKGQFTLQIEVRDNPNSNINLDFTGEGFREDVVFEGIKGDENELYFNSVIGQQQQISFTMHNVCEDDVRFQFPNHNDFTFTPRVGQLRKGQQKKITVNFFTEKPSKFNGLKMNCQWSKIKINSNEKGDWDDSMKVVKFVERHTLNPHPLRPPTAEERPKMTPRRFPGTAKRLPNLQPEELQQIVFQSPRGADHDLIKVVDIQPEPAYQTINSRQKDLQLRVFAVSDFIKYDISTKEIEFSSTMMFEKRSMEFTMTNTSQIRFEFNWRARQFGSLRTNYADSHPCPFTVEPSSGFLEADQVQTFTVNFIPEEVDDFSAHLVCDIPFLTQLDPPDIYVTGRSRRPVCHFYLETSDYLSAGRRHPDYTDPLPDDVRVIEMFAYELKKSTTKKFGILNATDTPYEVFWERVIRDKKDTNCPITCDYPRALISSGRKHIAQFSYNAVSVKTVESLWIFQIPEYKIRITFLIVGRMMPH
ncbi:hypothetical protein TRFO_41759 [Tritrichomonas foetus]|uniref:MSP domain-containing protein n=1 Tax=Tritrichomonas foetus TaxID=1144522 RepID=A0A1J4KZD0_9EUKA|nr:hypothetical protein TRFO_41759 [Tritrichomonas foetus]|eukprot:OHT16514.1 hypothetical protein TRFO_41759 [Tritrichomonas foetus]